MYDDCANGAGNLAKKSSHNNSLCSLHTQACTLIRTERKLCLEENNSSANSFRDSWKNKVMVGAKKIFPKLRITNTVLPCLLRFAKMTEIGGEMTTDFQ